MWIEHTKSQKTQCSSSWIVLPIDYENVFEKNAIKSVQHHGRGLNKHNFFFHSFHFSCPSTTATSIRHPRESTKTSTNATNTSPASFRAARRQWSRTSSAPTPTKRSTRSRSDTTRRRRPGRSGKRKRSEKSKSTAPSTPVDWRRRSIRIRDPWVTIWARPVSRAKSLPLCRTWPLIRGSKARILFLCWTHSVLRDSLISRLFVIMVYSEWYFVIFNVECDLGIIFFLLYKVLWMKLISSAIIVNKYIVQFILSLFFLVS